MHGPSEEKSDDSINTFYDELDQVFNDFPKYHLKVLLGDFNAKLEREYILTLTIGNESLNLECNDSDVMPFFML
jgi:hypothetical protein